MCCDRGVFLELQQLFAALWELLRPCNANVAAKLQSTGLQIPRSSSPGGRPGSITALQTSLDQS